MEPDEIVEDGDYVLVITAYRMRGAGSGMYLEQEVPHLAPVHENGLLQALVDRSATPRKRAAASWQATGRASETT